MSQSSTSSNNVLAARILFALLVFACTMQLMYWPLLEKGGWKPEWWQIRALKDMGEYLGLAPLLVVIFLRLSLVAAWIVSALWAYGVFVVSGRLVQLGARWIARFGLRRVAGRAVAALVLGVAATYAIVAIFKKDVPQPIIADVRD